MQKLRYFTQTAAVLVKTSCNKDQDQDRRISLSRSRDQHRGLDDYKTGRMMNVLSRL